MNQIIFTLFLGIFTASNLFANGAIFKHQLISSRSLKGANRPARNVIESLSKARAAVAKLEKKLSTYGDKFYEHIKDEKQGKGKWLQPKKVSMKQDAGNAMLLDYVDDYYLVNISLGTPPQWLLVQPSMFSSDFWVIDSECDDEVCLGAEDNFKRHLFNKSLSQSFRSTGEDVTSPYEYDAGIVSDELTIGGINVRQNFALAYELENWLYEEPMDGSLGLGSYPGTFDNVPPVMQTLKPLMDEPVFTIFIMADDEVSDDDSGGQMTFGEKDSVNCEPDWTYAMVNNHTIMSNYWEFQVNGFTIKNANKTVDNHRRRPAIIMLDFPFIVGPAGNIQTIAEALGFSFNPNYRAWTVPCGRVATMPDLQLKIADSMLVLKASQLIKKFNTGRGFICAMTLVPFENEGNGPAWYFGDTFLRSYCVSFEIGSGNGSQSVKKALQIGFAKTKPKVDEDEKEDKVAK